MKTREGFAKLFNRLGYKIGVEVGTYRGEFAEFLLRNCDSLELLYCIDPWTERADYIDPANGPQEVQDRYMREAVEKLRHFGSRCVVKREFSPGASNQFDDESLSFVYLDGDHSYEAVLSDLNAWYPKIRKGGMLCGHDYINDGFHHGCNFGVVSALKEFMQDKGKLHKTTEACWKSWYFVKEG